MGWFQRYGIPGAYFWGLSILWVAGLFPCEINSITKGDITAKIIGGSIIAASFLPIGYLVSILGQFIYLTLPWVGLDTISRKNAVSQNIHRWEFLNEAESVILAFRSPRKQFERVEFIQDWIRKRMDVIAINNALILAAIIIPPGILLFAHILGWNKQFDRPWFIIAVVVTSCVYILSLALNFVLGKQIVQIQTQSFSWLNYSYPREQEHFVRFSILIILLIALYFLSVWLLPIIFHPPLKDAFALRLIYVIRCFIE